MWHRQKPWCYIGALTEGIPDHSFQSEEIVIVDAGSSHTSVILYSWNDSMVLTEEYSCSNGIGIAQIKPSQVAGEWRPHVVIHRTHFWMLC